MNNFIQQVFISIARKMGLEMQTKQYYENDFYDTVGLSVTGTLADRLATLILADSDMTVNGGNLRSKTLQDIMNRFYKTRIKECVVSALGTGDCLTVPVTDGNHFTVDIVENKNFVIINSVGDFIYSVVMKREEFIKDNKTYERIEYHSLEIVDGIQVAIIRTFAFCNDKEISLEKVKAWETINPEIVIPNVDRLLFGRIKCPTVNRENINSNNGVPITFGLNSVVKNVKASYEMFNSEYSRKRTKIFFGKGIAAINKRTGEPILPKEGDFMLPVTSGLDGGQLPIKDFSPDLRYDGLKGGMDFNLRMLELFCGLSSGVMTPIETSMATATEIRASLHNTFAFITNVRGLIEIGLDDLVYAIDKLMNVNENTPIGSYTTSYNWSDAMVESSTEKYQQLLQTNGIGGVDIAEVRSWVMNEKLEESQRVIAEMNMDRTIVE